VPNVNKRMNPDDTTTMAHFLTGRIGLQKDQPKVLEIHLSGILPILRVALNKRSAIIDKTNRTSRRTIISP